MSFEDKRIFKFCGAMIVLRWSGVTGIEEKIDRQQIRWLYQIG